jgi:hypothetical protein
LLDEEVSVLNAGRCRRGARPTETTQRPESHPRAKRRA